MIGMYKIQEENVVTKRGGQYQVNCEGFGTVQVRTNFRRGGRDPIVCYKYNQPGLLAWDFQNPCTTCTYFHVLEHVTKDFPQLLEKW